MGNRAPAHGTIQNCSFYFKAFCPKNSSWLPFRRLSALFPRLWLYHSFLRKPAALKREHYIESPQSVRQGRKNKQPMYPARNITTAVITTSASDVVCDSESEVGPTPLRYRRAPHSCRTVSSSINDASTAIAVPVPPLCPTATIFGGPTVQQDVASICWIGRLGRRRRRRQLRW